MMKCILSDECYWHEAWSNEKTKVSMFIVVNCVNMSLSVDRRMVILVVRLADPLVSTNIMYSS